MIDTSTHPQLSMRNFKAEDLSEYQRWFEHNEINKFLGPMPDQTWLDHVLNDTEGIQLAVTSSKRLAVVIGVHFATPEHPTQIITDFAVNPRMLRIGMGSRALDLVISKFDLEADVVWQTFVDQDNKSAIAFFSKNLWQQAQCADNNNMLTFQYRSAN